MYNSSNGGDLYQVDTAIILHFERQKTSDVRLLCFFCLEHLAAL
jgi:hypothetical protein